MLKLTKNETTVTFEKLHVMAYPIIEIGTILLVECEDVGVINTPEIEILSKFQDLKIKPTMIVFYDHDCEIPYEEALDPVIEFFSRATLDVTPKQKYIDNLGDSVKILRNEEGHTLSIGNKYGIRITPSILSKYWSIA